MPKTKPDNARTVCCIECMLAWLKEHGTDAKMPEPEIAPAPEA